VKLDVQRLAQAADFHAQKEAIIEATREAVAGFDVFRNRILVATYVAPEKTKGGILLPDKTVTESRYQSKVGLVLKLGPIAFEFEGEAVPVRPDVGDWIIFRTADTGEIGLAGVSCRIVHDDLVIGRVQNPDTIW
jgi:co-chaperonin GroES (HSP10)